VIYLSKSLVKKILAITRNDADAEEFSQLVRMEGGKTIALPTIEIVPKDPKVILEFINELKENKHDYCAFMSQSAVNVLFDLANAMNKTDQVISLLNYRTIIAVGPKTKENLVNRGINVHLVPEKYSTNGIVELFSKMNLTSQRKKIIIPRSGASNDFVATALGKMGVKVDELFLYDVETSPTSAIWKDFMMLLEKKRIDAIIFTSSSTVQSFFEIMERICSDVPALIRGVKAVISIGPFTHEELRKKNINSVESKIHTIRGTFELAKGILTEN
jgi:uroporphyrinogen-III synthase